MTKQEAIDHFGDVKSLVAALKQDGWKATQQAIHKWNDDHIPPGRARQIENIVASRKKAG